MPLTALLPATRAPNPADLFEGVPDVVAPTAGDDEPVVDADEEAARAAAREAQRKFEEEQDALALEEEEAEMKAMEKPEDPPPTLRDIPDEIQGLILEKVIEGIAPGDMCGTRLYALCLSIRGSGGCDNPDDDVWRLACARLRVTRSVGTWRETFDALRRLDPDGRAALAGLMQGEDPYDPVEGIGFNPNPQLFPEDYAFNGYHPGNFYLELHGRGYLEWYLERHPRILKERVARLWSAAIINRLSCIVGFLLNTVDDIVDIGHFHGPDFHFLYGEWAEVSDGGGPSLDGVICWSALMYATSQGYTDIVEMLIAAHADVNVTSNHPLLRDEETVLMLADRGAHDDIATLLLNAGANDERRGAYGVDAFCSAAEHGDADAVRALLADARVPSHWTVTRGAGGTWHADLAYMLMLAASNGHANVVRLLIAAGADVEVTLDLLDDRYRWDDDWTFFDQQRACRLIRWIAPEPLEDDPNEWSAISDGAPLMCRKTHARKKEHLRTKRIDDQPRKKGRPVLKMHLPRKGKALMEMELEFSE